MAKKKKAENPSPQVEAPEIPKAVFRVDLVAESFSNAHPKTWAIPFLRDAAVHLNPHWQATAKQTEGRPTEERDDNGSYITEGWFSEGDHGQGIVCEWYVYQYEEMVGPAPCRRSWNFQVSGLLPGQSLTLGFSQSYPGSYSSVSESDLAVLQIQADEQSQKLIGQEFLSLLSPDQKG